MEPDADTVNVDGVHPDPKLLKLAPTTPPEAVNVPAGAEEQLLNDKLPELA